MADAGAASLRVSGLELGGLFGSLLAGKLSDMLINNSKGSGGNVGKRIQVGGWWAGRAGWAGGRGHAALNTTCVLEREQAPPLGFAAAQPCALTPSPPAPPSRGRW